jgi:hypothetical protein
MTEIPSQVELQENENTADDLHEPTSIQGWDITNDPLFPTGRKKNCEAPYRTIAMLPTSPIPA